MCSRSRGTKERVMKARRGLLIILAAAAILAAGCGHAPEPADPAAPLSILITNDDGIEAPGIAALADAFRGLGQVTVVAPRGQRSGASHSVTSDRAIAVREEERGGQRWIAVDAVPATCVRLGVEALLDAKPNLVLAGINKGENLGTVTFYSATVGAAREAAFLGIPAMAVNLASGDGMDYGPAASLAAEIVQALGPDGIPRGTFLNVNVPALPRAAWRGLRITRQDTRAPIDHFTKDVRPDGSVEYRPRWEHLKPGEAGTDIWALRNGYVSVSIFGFDQSAAVPPAAFSALKRRLESLPIQ
jgi:5'-nucleotidase